MRWIDGHLDLAYLALRGRDLRRELPPRDPSGCVSLPALRTAGVDAVFATIYTEPGSESQAWCYRPGDAAGAEAAGLRQIEVYDELERAGEIALMRATGQQVDESGIQSGAESAVNRSALRAVLLMEGADPIRSPEHLPRWRDMGVGIIGLTWAAGTRYAGGNGAPGPLTDAGRDLVAAMDAMGMIHDASHLADEALDGLLSHSRGPRGSVIASHSNCRALLDGRGQRHLRDEHIREIAGRGGVIGVNLYSRFLCTGRRATVRDAVRHVEHVAHVAGHRDCVGLGSDMDGGFAPGDLPADLDHPTKLSALAGALHDAGWSDDEIAGFAHGNWLRILGAAPDGAAEEPPRRVAGG